MEIDLMDLYPKSKRPIDERGSQITEEHRSVARQFGKEFFDGERLFGYGGYGYHPRFWTDTVARIRDYYDLAPDASILDVGCAKGFMLTDFKKLMPEATLAGIDVSEYAIENAHEDSEFAYLMQLIESSPSYNYVKKIRVGEIASKKFIAFERITTDAVSESAKDGLDLVSGLFGNTMGLFESRKGKLYGDEEARRRIHSILQPLDIILEKTPFRLTDKLIPGHFGHVAIWTGTKTELIDAGVWDNLIVNQYADQVSIDSDPDSKDQQQIIEALRSGVQLNTLEHFMNVDDIAILRPVFDEDKKDELIEEALLMAFRQLGKKYDFNFDVNTTDKIVCSELAYISFPSMDWPTEKTLGRHSISPDNVARLAWNNVPLQLVMFYHDGQFVDEAVQVEKMRELMTQ